MATELDFSTGKENRISVGVSGWTDHQRAEFESAVRRIDGVESIQGAGGRTSYYIYFRPDSIDRTRLRSTVTDIVRSIIPEIAASEPDTLDFLATEDGAAIVTEDGRAIAIERPMSIDAPVASSGWTGIASIPERIAAVKTVAPVALAAIDTLIGELQLAGANKGPPLDERQEAIDALRSLHNALGLLLAAVERPGFEWADGEGLFASCAHYAMRATEKLKSDPIPFAVGGLVVGLFTVCGFPGIGGFLASTSLAMQKKSR